MPVGRLRTYNSHMVMILVTVLPQNTLTVLAAKKRSPSKLFRSAALPRQHALCRIKKWPLKWLKILTSRLPFVRKICTTIGSRWLGLLVLYNFTCIQLNCACACLVSKKWSGQNPTSLTTCYGHVSYHACSI